MSLDDKIYVSLNDKEDSGLRSTVKVLLPVVYESLDKLIPLRQLFESDLAINASISIQACADLAKLASDAGEKRLLKGLGEDEEKWKTFVKDCGCGLKWINLFTLFPSVKKKVSLEFIISNMKKNHVRSYSIASCKSFVGNELHLVVGR